MKKYLFLILIVLSSCNNEKRYYSVVVYDEKQLNGQITRKEKIDTIFKKNDTLALVSAYTSYCISHLLDKKYEEEKIDDYSKTINFYLLNEKKEKVQDFLSQSEKTKIYNDIKKDVYSDSKDTISSKNRKKLNNSSYLVYQECDNVCLTSQDFIKQDLKNPSTADFSTFDCSSERNSDGSYIVLRKVTAKNSFGVEKEFIYKVTLGFKGGNWVDLTNWDLIKIQSEEYR